MRAKLADCGRTLHDLDSSCRIPVVSTPFEIFNDLEDNPEFMSYSFEVVPHTYQRWAL